MNGSGVTSPAPPTSTTATTDASTPPRRLTEPGTALVTGVSGYVGGLLVQPLLEAGWRVRVFTRKPEALADRPWASAVEIVPGDAGEPADLARALAGVDVAYYLLHSMDGQDDFARRDRHLAEQFARAATDAGVARIVYLGGLHPDGEELSPHLASRVEVGQVFLDSPVPAACLQAAVIIGYGSASFQMLRYLTQRLPAMVAPRWLNNRIQPIAIDDVLRYLVGSALLPPEVNRTFDIGGPDVLTYADMIHRFAELTGLRERAVVTVPVLTPRLASHWVGLVTPLSSGIAKPLVASLIHEVVCAEHDIATYLPDPPGGLIGYDDAVRRAMANVSSSGGVRNLLQTGLATGAASLVGAWASQPDAPWYQRLDLPAWQPPGAAFPLVWGALYADIIGTSSSALTSFEERDMTTEAAAFRRALAVNLALNAGWSVVFWRARRPWLATITAAALAASSADLTRRAALAGRRHRYALAPYAAWCTFATLLNAEVARRNPDPAAWRPGAPGSDSRRADEPWQPVVVPARADGPGAGSGAATDVSGRGLLSTVARAMARAAVQTVPAVRAVSLLRKVVALRRQ